MGRAGCDGFQTGFELGGQKARIDDSRQNRARIAISIGYTGIRWSCEAVPLWVECCRGSDRSCPTGQLGLQRIEALSGGRETALCHKGRRRNTPFRRPSCGRGLTARIRLSCVPRATYWEAALPESRALALWRREGVLLLAVPNVCRERRRPRGAAGGSLWRALRCGVFSWPWDRTSPGWL